MASLPAGAGPDGDGTSPGFFSQEQAERGRAGYEATCKECHAISEFKGEEFEWTWRRQTAWNLYEAMATTMPEDDPGGLGAEAYVDIVAYLLQVNDYRAGSRDLAATESELAAIALGAGAAKTRSAE